MNDIIQSTKNESDINIKKEQQTINQQDRNNNK
jgi:hypothetical protein